MYNDVQSVRVGSCDLYDSLVDFDDLAFLELIDTMQQADGALRSKLANIRKLNHDKQALLDRLDRFTKALEGASDKDDGDQVDVPGEEMTVRVFAEDTKEIKASSPTAEALNKANKEAVEKEIPLYTKGKIKAEIERMKNELEQMNTSSSVMLIDLNRLMNKRNEAVQLTSNIIRKDNETALSVIKNF